MSKKNIIIIEGPSGVGKDTIIDQLITRYPDRFDRPVNATTRAMRENERQGYPYLFISEDEFRRLRLSGEIFEQTIRHGTYRGMRKSSFDGIINTGKIALRDCDKNGLASLKKEYPDQVIGIFLTCDKEDIKRRLKNRNEPIESMNARLADFDKCIKDAYFFDYVIENNDIENTIKQIVDIINQNN